jgi:hypothetical protein
MRILDGSSHVFMLVAGVAEVLSIHSPIFKLFTFSVKDRFVLTSPHICKVPEIWHATYRMWKPVSLKWGPWKGDRYKHITRICGMHVDWRAQQ